MKLFIFFFILHLCVEDGAAYYWNQYRTGCKYKVCPKWTRCTMKKPICKKAPCFPVATCVSLPNTCLNVACGSLQTCVEKRRKPVCINNPCVLALCQRGFVCVLQRVTCIRLPCDPVSKCVPNPCEKFNCRRDQTCQVLPIDCGPARCTFCARPVCVDNNPCILPKDPGTCEAAIPRWFFNKASNRCEKFTYGGCEGNGNNFPTQAACQRRCGVHQHTCENFPCPKGEKCRLVDTGIRCITTPCPSFIPKCFPLKICRLPAETGPCKAAFPRWFYNSKTGRCETFTYGGCQGNDNRFKTKEACEKFCGKPTCKNFPCPKGEKCELVRVVCVSPPCDFDPVPTCVPTDICRLPSVTGPCRAGFTRWFFNSKSGQCETFTYGGCRGNDNRFKTKEDCEKRCGGKPGGGDKCQDGRKPLTDNSGLQLFCGRGPKSVNCPPNSKCIIDPTDRFAFCCRNEIPEQKCPDGSNALVKDNGEKYFCGFGLPRDKCPDASFCFADPADRFAICCRKKKKVPTATLR